MNAPAEKLFHFLSNMNNLKELMPAQVEQWQSTEKDCSFRVSGLTSVSLRLADSKPFSEIIYAEGGKMPFSFGMNLYLKPHEDSTGQTWLQLVFRADLNPMMKMMVEKPLSNFVNMLASAATGLAGKV